EEKREVGYDIPEVGHAPDGTLIGKLVVPGILRNRREKESAQNKHDSESGNQCDAHNFSMARACPIGCAAYPVLLQLLSADRSRWAVHSKHKLVQGLYLHSLPARGAGSIGATFSGRNPPGLRATAEDAVCISSGKVVGIKLGWSYGNRASRIAR